MNFSLEHLNARAVWETNASPCAQHALAVHRDDAFRVAEWLKGHGFDYCSNVTGVDYPEHIEVVYHLYSIANKQGPLPLKIRTQDRTGNVTLPSLTPLWKSAEFQEREVFDLFGVRFEGHPDLRRLLMWEEFVDHPLRKDYR